MLPGELPGHPRLLASKEDWSRLKRQAASDRVSMDICEALREHASKILRRPPVQRILTGPRLLLVSRDALDCIATLSLLGCVFDEPAYIDRAIEEMLAVARFSDWHPDHFLDVGEMSLALSIGYDWLYEKLTASQRSEIVAALVEKGLRPSLDDSAPYNGWLSVAHNWAQVCHGGLSAAAIAVADLEPELSETILKRALEKLPGAAAVYAPDGVYPEGPTYWNYGTTYHVILSAALRHLCDQAFGLDTVPGLAGSAGFLDQVTAPTGKFFNYSDSNTQRRFHIPLFWLARRFERPEWISGELLRLSDSLKEYEADGISADHAFYRTLPLALLWYQPQASPPPVAPLHWLGKGETPIAVHRSHASSPDAVYVAMKGGSPSSNHAHMDEGSFILEADGVRWAVDLGLQEYFSLEKENVRLWDATQDGQRWEVFRLGPECHNILRFDDARQLVKAHADFVRFESSGPHPCSVLDLSAIYAHKVSSARRGIMMLENRAILFQDEWVAGERPTRATWQMVTDAEVEAGDGWIRLDQDGKSLILKILEPEGSQVVISDMSAPVRPYDAENPGLKRIQISQSTGARMRGRFRILAAPGTAQPAAIPDFPLH